MQTRYIAKLLILGLLLAVAGKSFGNIDIARKISGESIISVVGLILTVPSASNFAGCVEFENNFAPAIAITGDRSGNGKILIDCRFWRFRHFDKLVRPGQSILLEPRSKCRLAGFIFQVRPEYRLNIDKIEHHHNHNRHEYYQYHNTAAAVPICYSHFFGSDHIDNNNANHRWLQYRCF